MHKSNWRLWCRLCGIEVSVNTAWINIFTEDVQIDSYADAEWKDDCENLSLAKIIEKYFSVKLVNDEHLPRRICNECYMQISSFITFARRMVKMQAMFNVLKANQIDDEEEIDVNEIRTQYTSLEVHTKSLHQINAGKNQQVLSAIETQEDTPIENMDEEFSDDTTDETSTKVNYLTGDYLKCHKENGTNDDKMFEDVEFLSEDLDIEYLSDNSEINKSDIEEDGEEEILICNESSILNEENPLQKTGNKSSVLYTCEECSKSFRRGFYYTKHMKIKHNVAVEIPVQKCSECDRVFNSSLLLAKHLKLHLPLEKRRVHKCEECNTNFTNASSLRSHIKYAHENERNFVCNECGAAFHRGYAFRTHMLVHSGVTPYSCEVCNKGFKEKTKLRLHMETHNSTKYSCSKCDLKFNSRYTLKCHQLVHSDKMPFKCDYCGRELKRSKSFKYHLLRHVGLKPYLCNYCDSNFTSAYYCRMHQQRTHPTEYAALGKDTSKGYTVSMPNISELRSITKTSKDLEPVSHSRRKCSTKAG